MTQLDEWLAVRIKSGFHMRQVFQCQLGCEFAKPTAFFGSIDVGTEYERCAHPSRKWKIPPDGRVVTGPHPPLRGKLKAVPEEN